MPYAKLSDTFGSDPLLLTLPRGIRLLWVEGLSYCGQHLTDGLIPRHSLNRITDEPEPLEAAAQLVGAGLWEEVEAGWQMVGYLDHQWSRDKIEQAKAYAAARKERNRLHNLGDHSQCLEGRFCPNGAIKAGTRDSTRTGQRRSQAPIPSDPLRPTGRRGEGGEGAIAPPPLTLGGGYAPGRIHVQ